MGVPVVKFLDGTSFSDWDPMNPVERGQNFIQVYIDKKPYFRSGSEIESPGLLESLLEDFNNPNENRNYDLVGEGQILGGSFIKKNSFSFDDSDFYAIKGNFGYYDHLPNISHFSKILGYFDKPLIYIGDAYFTEEEKGFLFYRSDEDDARDGIMFLDDDISIYF